MHERTPHRHTAHEHTTAASERSDGGAGRAAPDGSPVPVYLAIPTEPGFTPALDAMPTGARVLDLGCGVGRLANELVERGHSVVGVDESPAMLAHVDDRVETVLARIEDLDLDRRFDVVVLASQLVNTRDDNQRRALLAAGARHLDADGQIFIEHHEVDFLDATGDVEGRVGSVDVVVRILDRRGDEFDGEVTYDLDGARWVQTFTSRLLDEADLDAALARAGLRRGGWLSPRWLIATR